MTTTPSIDTMLRTTRIASTAAPSAAFFSPRPIHLPPASAAASVARMRSIARLRSGRCCGSIRGAPVPKSTDVTRTARTENMGRLDGSVAVVTGAASGIGLACVARFAAEGARVVGEDITEPRAERTPAPADVSYAQADVRNEDALANVFDAAFARHGRIDAVVTAAGVAGGGPAHLLDRDEWQRVLDVNLTGTFLS